VAERDDDERCDRNERAIVAAAGAVLGGIVAGPLGAAVGAGLGPLLEPLVSGVWAELSARARQRQTDVLFWAIQNGVPVDEMEERINASEQTQLLTGVALIAASRTAWEDKVRTLGGSLASGLLAEDDATIDTEQMIIAAIADIEGPQLAMLELLVRWAPGRMAGGPPIEGPLDVPDYSHSRSHDGSWRVHDRKWSSARIACARPNLAPVAPSLLGILQRHGLVVQNDNAAEAIENYAKEFEKLLARQIGQQTRAGASRLSGAPHVGNVERLVPALTWSPTKLGEQVFLRFLDAGTNVPDEWAAGPAEEQK
jgi:hypothetical protein